MGSGGNQNHHQHNHHHHMMNLLLHLSHLHIHHDHHRDIPKGFLAILVGQEEEKLRRFVIPVIYVNHPLFMQLLEEAEEKFGFNHEGPITIPCNVEVFRSVQRVIDEEQNQHHHHHYHNHHHHRHHVWCF